MDDEVNANAAIDPRDGNRNAQLLGRVSDAIDSALAPFEGCAADPIKAAVMAAFRCVIDPEAHAAEQAEHEALVSRDENDGVTGMVDNPEQALVDDDAKEEPLLDFAPPAEHEISGKLDF